MPTAEIEPARVGKQPWALQDLPPYRPVAKKLMRLTAREDVPLPRVQEVLRTDAVFSAEVLRLANSPLISARGEITSILHAVAMLGLERIKSLATTLVLRTFVTTGTLTDALRGCWRHNLATAIICDRVARFVHVDREIGYTAGLLHDVGRLGLLRTGSNEYEGILSREGVSDLELLQFERSVFDIDHCEAGLWILEQWEFPRSLCDVALLHHQRPKIGAVGLLPLVYAGWRIADFLGFSAGGQIVPGDISELVEVLPEAARQHIIGGFDGLAEEVAFKINAIECSLV
jgi:putative nucleotidyltransferase with HDIG domain